MSYQNFEKALELAKQCEFYMVKGERSGEVVAKAEELVGFKFSKQNFEFFKKTGYLSFSGNEFYGICKDDFSGSYTGCSVEATLQDRKEYNLPPQWLTIYFFDDGYMGYLDYGQLNEDGEPPVIMAIYNGDEYVVTEKVAEDLGDFILQLVENQLARQ
ncbi:MAG: SMI1/KNR4 family protein [Chloroflexi bacterium]|nr:SMI1/KNR4 family protein [Chloroflexota bacterium]